MYVGHSAVPGEHSSDSNLAPRWYTNPGITVALGSWHIRGGSANGNIQWLAGRFASERTPDDPIKSAIGAYRGSE
jgi:hypothetical protein